MPKTLSVAQQKKALLPEYVALALSKLGLDYTDDAEGQKVLLGQPLAFLTSGISRMKKLEDYTDAPALLNMPLESEPEARVSRGSGNTMGYGKSRPSNGPTDKQKALIIRLKREKEGVTVTEDDLTVYTVRTASVEIDRLINMPRKAAPAPVAVAAPATTQKVPAGIYAIMADGEVKCYELDHGKEGTRWDGFEFLSRVSSDDRWPIKNRDEKARIMSAIQADVEAAGRLAAQTLRRCRNPKCKRTLSDTKNPHYGRGYGPDCGELF